MLQKLQHKEQELQLQPSSLLLRHLNRKLW
jgi:hypothetical protein